MKQSIMLLGLLLCLVLASSPPVASAQCPSKVTHNFLAPFKRMPPVRDISPVQPLPFGPADVRIETAGGLTPGGGKIGFSLASVMPDRVQRLNWRLEMRAVRINARGQERGVIVSKAVLLSSARKLGRNPVELTTWVDGHNAFYRLELKIFRGEEKLGQFGNYVRVLPYRVRAKLAVSSLVVSPGESLQTRVQNLGTSSLSFGVGLLFDQWKAGGWIPVGDPEFIPGSAVGIPIGSSGPCESIRLPSDLEPGTYRLSKEVSAGRRTFFVRRVLEVR